ncbi:hypothetical protein NBRC10512_004052 [Rhodotorula toruloides]|uniref:RHTO0S03e08152g1_1 n=2 Tax=Rhodotorula toruloides TaxID=5286 RepID=A0A061AUB1_RHOTO|nr:F-box domain contaning protein [Rhodotorula toruloides NP11]EMS25966.1 F-box domain contaning protein [Rhodotorula toruloides NP11]CDR38313.1 RHTO0S03e08152g1_1 [Rhodotorula toruloides]
MPLFFSSASKRRKSEANLRKPKPDLAAPPIPPSLPMPERLSVFGSLETALMSSGSGSGERGLERSRPGSGKRSVSEQRSEAGLSRPGREEETRAKQAVHSAALDGRLQPGQSTKQLDADMPITPPRRNSSLFQPSRTHTDGSLPSAAYAAQPQTTDTINLNPPPSNGSTPTFAQGEPETPPKGISQALASPTPALSPSYAPALPLSYKPSFASNGIVGVPVSSSFYGAPSSPPTSPPTSPPRSAIPPRRDSLLRPKPSAEAHIPTGATRRRERTVDGSVGIGEADRPERDEAPQGFANGTIRQASAGEDSAVSLGAAYVATSLNGTPTQQSSPQPSLPPGAAPPSPPTALSASPRPAYNALAAFYGTTSPSLSTLSSSSEDVTANASTRFFTRQFSSDGSLTTPSLSAEEGDSTESKARVSVPGDEQPTPPEYGQKLEALQDAFEQTPPPVALSTASPEPAGTEHDSTTPTPTPTLASFPVKTAPSPPAPADTPARRSRRTSLFESATTTVVTNVPSHADSLPKKLTKKPPGKNRDSVRPLQPQLLPKMSPTSPASPVSAEAAPVSQLVVSRPPRRTSLLPSPVIPPTSPPQPFAHSRSPPTSPRAPAYQRQPFPPEASPKRIVRSEADAIRLAALKAARQREEQEQVPTSQQGSEDQAAATPLTDADGRILQPRFEYAFATYPPTILKSLVGQIRYADLLSLRNVSKTMRRAIDVEGRELVLERFLGSQGYRSLASAPAGHKYRPDAAAGMLNLDVRDLIAFRAGLQLGQDDYSRLARAYTVDPARFSTASLRLARATTRAWNRVALRLRAQSMLPSSSLNTPAYPVSTASSPAYKPGRAAFLRVWVPTRDGGSWMTDNELVECEREVYRSGVWTQLKKGDVVANVGVVLPFGNVSKLVFDGKFLRDLSFAYDAVGHLPNWLNMLSFSPAYFHNVIVSSTPNPVIHLSLAPYTSAVRETMTLCKDKVSLSSPQGRYLVSRYVYRGTLRLVAGQIIGDAAGAGGLGPGGIEVVHEDWAGQVVVETEGTTEHATMLLARVASVEPTPWRVIREKSRPGRIWLRPVLENETA